MELPDRSAKEILNKSKPTSNELPLQLQALIKGTRTSAIIMAVISVISVYFIPWAVFYIILATKLKPEQLPSRKLIKWAAIATLPLCLGLIPILIDVEFWKMNKKLKEYEESGSKAFISDKEFLVGEPKRKKRSKIALAILLSIIAIFAVLIIVAIASSSSDSGTTPTSPNTTTNSEIQAAKDKMDSLTAQYKQCSSDLAARESSVNKYSQSAVDSYNSDWQSCEDTRLEQNAAVDSYNSMIDQ
jgi:hypothetical protein